VLWMGAVTRAKRGASPDGVGEFGLEFFQGQVVAVLLFRLRSLGTQTKTRCAQRVTATTDSD
jgi:hypothetical protein